MHDVLLQTQRRFVLTGLGAAALITQSGCASTQPNQQTKSIEKGESTMTVSTAAAAMPLKNYIRAHETGDASFIAQAFSADARIRGEMGGNLIDWGVAEYMARFSGSPAADEASRKRSYVILDATEKAASGKVILNYPAVDFVDYMSLLLIDGSWKIVAKTFMATPK
jgi:Putative lumazine-binding